MHWNSGRLIWTPAELWCSNSSRNTACKYSIQSARLRSLPKSAFTLQSLNETPGIEVRVIGSALVSLVFNAFKNSCLFAYHRYAFCRLLIFIHISFVLKINGKFWTACDDIFFSLPILSASLIIYFTTFFRGHIFRAATWHVLCSLEISGPFFPFIYFPFTFEWSKELL